MHSRDRTFSMFPPGAAWEPGDAVLLMYNPALPGRKTLFVSALVSSKPKDINLEPILGFEKAVVIADGATAAELLSAVSARY